MKKCFFYCSITEKKRNKKIKQTRDAFRLFTTLDINCLSELKYMKKVKRTDFFLLKELQTAHIFFLHSDRSPRQ